MAMTRKFLLSSVVAAAVLAAACADERSITTEPVGDLGFGINLAKQSTNLPRGYIRFPSAVPSANPSNDSLIVVLRGLDSLPAGSNYAVWVADDSSTAWFRATGARLTAVRVDTTFNRAGDPVFAPTTFVTTGVNGFSNGGSGESFRFATSRAAITGVGTTNIGVALVTIETSATATTPSNNRIIWARRSERNGAGGGANDSSFVRFGTFGKSVALQFAYSITTNAGAANLVILPRGRVEVRGPVMVLNDSNYLRPPAGYYYAAYAIKFDTLQGRFQDTVYLGRRTTPFPEQISLYDADFGQATNPAPGIVLESSRTILGMRTRVSADSLPKAQGTKPWREFGLVAVTLESKRAVEGKMGSSIIMQAFLPKSIRGR
jgi:hypothetical protein